MTEPSGNESGSPNAHDAHGKPAGHSNLYLRVASALVLAPAFLALVWYGGVPFLVVLLVSSLLILNEWCRITRTADWVAVLGGGGLIAAGAAFWWATDLEALTVIVVTAVIAAGIAILTKRRPWVALGILYAGLPLIALAALRSGEVGLWALALALALTWATDILAYFAGKTFGGPKLWPTVSPKKTWSGAIGGLVGGGLAGCAVALVSGIGAPLTVGLLSAGLSIASQLGDLGESALKRHFGVKDSGTLIPGHGGIMDRVDGLVTAAVAMYVIGMIASLGTDPSRGLSML